MLFCNQCGIPMKVEKNGVACVDVDHEGKPYKVYMGDTYQCPCCDRRVTATKHNPAYVSWQSDFKETLIRFDSRGMLIPSLEGLI